MKERKVSNNIFIASIKMGFIFLKKLTHSPFKILTSRWVNHSARINSLSWTSDSQYCASGSLDTHVYVWSVAKPTKSTAVRNAGPGGVNAVLWLEGGKDGRLVSAGADACVRVWEVKFPG